ncbi:MAG TPA: hypothetical protein VHY58_12860 [Streptosporangiaceae bacterium]|nr:hypothetical protein [Streptosporangiaceae bacterium]
MRISKSASVSAAVVVAFTAAVLPVSFLTASASTTACGKSCTSPYVESVGAGQALTVSGSSVVMAAASTTNSAQDWTPQAEGSVSNATAAGVVSGKLDMLYSTDTVVEYRYAPNGVPSGQCLADASTTNINFTVQQPTLTVVLAQCGVTAQTLWILDADNAANGYVDLINAGYEAPYTYLAPDIDSSVGSLTSPYAETAALTVNSSGKVVLATLSEIGGVVSPTQMWANWSSPAQSQLRANVEKAH